MKKSLLLLGAMLSTVSVSYAGRVKLPAKEILAARLIHKGFDHFVEKTNLVENLAGQEKEVMGVIMAVELSLYDYNQYMQQSVIAMTMAMRKPELIEIILEGNDGAIMREASVLLAEIAQQK